MRTRSGPRLFIVVAALGLAVGTPAEAAPLAAAALLANPMVLFWAFAGAFSLVGALLAARLRRATLDEGSVGGHYLPLPGSDTTKRGDRGGGWFDGSGGSFNGGDGCDGGGDGGCGD